MASFLMGGSWACLSAAPPSLGGAADKHARGSLIRKVAHTEGGAAYKRLLCGRIGNLGLGKHLGKALETFLKQIRFWGT